jgi:PTH1 family peptidyl-tRNA hydrolase
MKLVVGLGNPGTPYAGTRHNIGFEVIERLSERLGFGAFDRLAKSKFGGLALDGRTAGADGAEQTILLLKPMTYMNVSGNSVQAAAAFYRLAPADLLIVLDDLALPCGRIRLRAGGSDGGHNGLRDIQRALGTCDYPRLRVGIDPPPPQLPGRDYVLGRFTDEQRRRIDPAIDRAASAIVLWIERGIDAAMNQYNVAGDDDAAAET